MAKYSNYYKSLGKVDELVRDLREALASNMTEDDVDDKYGYALEAAEFFGKTLAQVYGALFNDSPFAGAVERLSLRRHGQEFSFHLLEDDVDALVEKGKELLGIMEDVYE
jgi:hypothetical protein